MNTTCGLTANHLKKSGSTMAKKKTIKLISTHNRESNGENNRMTMGMRKEKQ